MKKVKVAQRQIDFLVKFVCVFKKRERDREGNNVEEKFPFVHGTTLVILNFIASWIGKDQVKRQDSNLERCRKFSHWM